MREYSCNGVPVEHMKSEDIERYLRKGVVLMIDRSYATEQEHIKARLALELFIREKNLRAQI